MSMQQYCLRWNNHQPNFISVFSNLLNNETLVDVTLAAEGRQIQAHKVVLSACSTYFQSLFTVNPCQHPIVILKDIKYSDLKIMVDFMYYGEVNISQDQLPSIIKTAESLKIKGLAEMHTASLTKWPSGSSETGGGDRGESCSPSPSPLSPSFRRKRLRKSSTGSTSGSGDKPEEINEITLVATNIVKPEPLIASQESGENLRQRPVNTSTESQGSIDEDQISIMSNMETSSANTPAQSDGSIQDVSQPTATNIGQPSSVSSQPPVHQVLQCKQSPPTEKKRPRLLIRQPRLKKEPTLSAHQSPESDSGSSPHIVTPTLNLPQASRSLEESRVSPPAHTILVSHPNLLAVTTSSSLLTVPQPAYLTKQHSHPLLSSQQPSTSGTYWIQRQHSHPELPGRTTSPSIIIEPAPVIKTEEELCDETTPTPTTTTASDPLIGSSSGGSVTTTGGLRVKSTELRRASSSPQTSSREPSENTGDHRSGHCPVLRQGPALGCNHCWNTIDDHGRILRRKTKYQCPQCQINLCIVPCFQEYHEQRRDLTSKLKPLPKTGSV
ncbi:protein tramtrack, alpha isoform isoform X2 [Pseudomyrmex gracilis]|uniref:protein tramtrack, alpha isoform isoform X2 n=1 Tax=Pseudomyrmex gracilis TaxID=219809 RepID=UPI000995BD4C|nr:protein tramtrack, alpha isoform isoform X2 [Pseudomyrmex gracilis]